MNIVCCGFFSFILCGLGGVAVFFLSDVLLLHLSFCAYSVCLKGMIVAAFLVVSFVAMRRATIIFVALLAG